MLRTAINQVVLTALFLLFSTLGLAQQKKSAPELYVSAGANAAIFRVDRARFNPLALEFRAGYYLQPQLAAEVVAMTGLGDDESGALEASLTGLYGVNLRFETPERDGSKIMILLGYSAIDIDLSLNDSDFPGSETFDGFSYGLASEYRLDQAGHWFAGAKILRYLNKDDISFDTLGLTLRYVY